MTDKYAAFVSSEKKVRMIQACKDKKTKADYEDWSLDLVIRGKLPEEWASITQSLSLSYCTFGLKPETTN